jgi:hypothetical protein
VNRLQALLERASRDSDGITESRFGFEDWLKSVGDPLQGLRTTMAGEKADSIGHSFEGYVRGALQSNGAVFAAELARVSVFSEARFRYRPIVNGKPGALFGKANLALLERPWPGATTSDLLAQQLVDGDFAGTAYHVVWDGQVVRLRPDKVSHILEPLLGPQGRRIGWKRQGILYREEPTDEAAIFLPEEVAIFVPGMPDPLHPWRGMSWLTPVIRDIQTDGAITKHKLRTMENSATPNLAVKLPKEIRPADFRAFVDKMKRNHDGPDNAGKTLYLGGGADVTAVGVDFRSLELKSIQGAGETRIAAASGTGAIIAQLSESMQGSALTQGNYNAARRRFADITIRPLWRNAAGTLETLVPPPNPGSELWYDETDIAFLREDALEGARAQQVRSTSINTLVNAGFEPKSVIAAVTANDFTLLVHTGRLSVQLQDPSATTDVVDDDETDDDDVAGDD